MPSLQSEARRPFPLLRRFIVIGGPIFLLFLIALGVGSLLAMRATVEEIYLQFAEQRANGLAAEVSHAHPVEWGELLAGREAAAGSYGPLAEAFAKEAREFHLERLKVYDTIGRTLFSMIPAEIGKVESGDALRQVLSSLQPGLDRTRDPGGAEFYELYVPYLEDGRLVAVFELYEPIGYLDSLLLEATFPAAAVPILLLGLLAAVLFRLAQWAQRDIDWRTRQIEELTMRVERLVSRRAVKAMQDTELGSLPEPHLVECTLLFCDIRGFTAFAERSSPREVIATLNAIVAQQVQALEVEGADVDKFIGDAVFARFEGPGRAASAIRAAGEIQRRMRASGAPLQSGIGIASGSVVAGVIGASDRYDYTVLGDAVNLAARLCAAAGAGEVVVDSATADLVPSIHGARELLPIKGRSAAVQVIRMAPAAVA